MRRRDLLKAILGGLVGWSSIGRAQNTGGVRHLAVLILNPEGDPQGKKRVDVLEQDGVPLTHSTPARVSLNC